MPVALGTICLFLFFGLVAGGMWGCPRYAVYEQGFKGEAELVRTDILRLLEHINRQKSVIAWLAVSVAEAYGDNVQGKFQCTPDADGWSFLVVQYKGDAAATWIEAAYQQTEPKPCLKN